MKRPPSASSPDRRAALGVLHRPIISVIGAIGFGAIAIALAFEPASAGASDWPSYNRTLESERFAPISTIKTSNVKGLRVVCAYDTKQMSSFETGLVQVGRSLYGVTAHDTFSIDADTCRENWRVHEEAPATFLNVDRGVAYLDGRIFRGLSDGTVIAYDAATGRRLWATSIADAKGGEDVDAAPIAWNGLVFIGNAGGDNKGVKGRMYALDASTGQIVWEFFLVPKSPTDVARGPIAPMPSEIATTWNNDSAFPIAGGATWTSYTLDPERGLLYVPGGNPAPDFINAHRKGANLYTGSVVVLDAKTGAYRRHFQIVPNDFHDWDVSTAPSLVTTKAGTRLMVVAPKDGHLYGYDLSSDERVYRTPVTTIENVDAPLTAEGTRFCPGSQGGAEWNGPAYDPRTNTIFTGEVDWCATVRTDPDEKVQSAAYGQPWSGSPDGFGVMDSPRKWAGWFTASDAETGAKKWQFKAQYPIMSGVTPTAGGIVLFGDMGGNLYAFDSRKGTKLWWQDLGGAVGGGVITYDTGAGQKVAVAVGLTSAIWPTKKVTGKIVVLGL